MPSAWHEGQYSLAFGALLLAFANIVGIQVAGSIVMWLGGYRGSPQYHFGSGFKSNVLSVAALCILAVVLRIELREVISKEVYEVSVRKILNTSASTHEGAYLAEVRFRREAGHLFVVADYRTPVPFTPGEVAALQLKLPLMRGASSLDLRIRSIPVIVASKTSYLFSSEDLSDYVRQQ